MIDNRPLPEIATEDLSFLKKGAIALGAGVLIYLMNKLFGGDSSGGGGGGGGGGGSVPAPGKIANDLEAVQAAHAPAIATATEGVVTAASNFPTVVARTAEKLNQQADAAIQAAAATRAQKASEAEQKAKDQAAEDAKNAAAAMARNAANKPTAAITAMVEEELLKFMQKDSVSGIAGSLSDIKFYFNGHYTEAYVNYALGTVTCMLTSPSPVDRDFKHKLAATLNVIDTHLQTRLVAAADILAAAKVYNDLEVMTKLRALPTADISAVHQLIKAYNTNNSNGTPIDVIEDVNSTRICAAFPRVCVAVTKPNEMHARVFKEAADKPDVWAAVGFKEIELIWAPAAEIMKKFSAEYQRLKTAYEGASPIIMESTHSNLIYQQEDILRDYLTGVKRIVDKFENNRGLANARKHLDEAYTHSNAFLKKLRIALENPT